MPITLSPPAHLPPARPNCRVSSPPKSKLGKFCWRWWLWFATTFGLTALETWEQILFLTLFTILSALFLIGMLWYLPQHLLVVERRAVYYLWGHEDVERHWWGWLGFRAVQTRTGLHKEL